MNNNEMNEDMDIYMCYNDEDIFDKISQIHPFKSDPLTLKRQYSHKLNNDLVKF